MQVADEQERHGGEPNGSPRRWPSGDGATGRSGLAPWAGANGGHAAALPADAVIHRLFAVGLDLHGALARMRGTDDETAADRIRWAIDGLDQAIKDFRRVVFDLWPPNPYAPAGPQAVVVDAVKRVCASGGCPAITVSGGGDDVTDEAAARQVAELVQEVLAMVPVDLLPRAHIVVVPDRRPPAGLVVQIDVPGTDLGDVAARLGAPDGRRVVVSCQTVASPARSRIRLECPAIPP